MLSEDSSLDSDDEYPGEARLCQFYGQAQWKMWELKSPVAIKVR